MVEESLDVKGNSFTGLYDPADNVFVGPVRVMFASNAVYEGGLAGNRFEGQGVLKGEQVSADGAILSWRFEGTFENGRLEGEGMYRDHQGRYIGEFINSLPSGKGIYYSNSGWRYEGEFVAGMMTGQGTVILANGTSSSGQFEDGLQVSVKEEPEQ